MNTKRSLSAITICIAFCMVFASCKKDKEMVTPPVPDCKIVTITATSTGGPADGYKFDYNADGSIKTITNGPAITEFSYSGNTIMENLTVAGAFKSKVMLTLNAAGFITNRHTETNVTGTLWQNEAVEYTGTQASKSTFTTSSSSNSSTTVYTWSGGNLTSIASPSSVVMLEYYTDKPSSPGDYLQLVNLLQGGMFHNSKNPLKSIGVPGQASTGFVYTYDAGGKISKLTANTGTTEAVYTYGHLCK